MSQPNSVGCSRLYEKCFCSFCEGERKKVADQPAPVTNSSRPIWELVVEDMKDRDRVGRERYGTPLQAFNGRDALIDAYQEALDLAVYLRQAIEERRQVGK